MNYIYDILLNFNKNLYDFFEWNNNDKIIHIKKIPFFKLSTNEFNDLKNGLIIINNSFLQKIKYKTEAFNKTNNNKLKYTTLISDGKTIIAIKFNKNGKNYMKSVLPIDEEEDILEIVKNKKEIHLKYKYIKDQKQNPFKTRFELENKKFIEEEISKMYKNNNFKKLNYICLECLGKTEDNIDKTINLIKKEIINKNDNFYKIYKTLKMINQR